MTVPWPVGGPSDVLARNMEFAIETNSKVKIAVLNQGGASGNIGMRAFTQKDRGLLLISENIFTNKKYLPDTYSADLLPSIQPVYFFGNSPYIVYAHKKFQTFDQLVEESRKKEIIIGSGAPGSGSYETYNLLCNVRKILSKCRLVVYRGAGDAIIDLMAGRIDIFNSLFSAYNTFTGTGDVTALVTLSKTRPVFLDMVPTSVELGYDIENDNWFGLFHKGLTLEEVNSLAESFEKYFTRPKLNSLGFDTLDKKPNDFWEYQKHAYKTLY